jgi:hypothetical protein
MTNVCISEGDSGKPSALRDDDAAKLQPGSENGRASARVRGAAQVEDVLSDVTTAAKELIPDADTAGVLLVGKGGKFELSIRRSGGPSRFRYLEWALRHAIVGRKALLVSIGAAEPDGYDSMTGA